GEPEPVQPYENGRVKVFTKQSDQAHVIVGVPSYPIDHPDRYALQMVATVLGGGMSSRLFTEVRERLGLAYYVFCHHQSYEDAGTLFSQAGVDINRIDLAVQTIVREFGKLVHEPVDEVELRRTKNYLKGRIVLQLEDPRGLLSFGMRREVLEDRLAEPDEVLEGIEAVTAKDIERLAGDVIRNEGLNFGLVGPFDDDARFLELLSV
ncbi:MAG TPA: insulinase family protein, partial [Gaiellales bacterium]